MRLRDYNYVIDHRIEIYREFLAAMKSAAALMQNSDHQLAFKFYLVPLERIVEQAEALKRGVNVTYKPRRIWFGDRVDVKWQDSLFSLHNSFDEAMKNTCIALRNQPLW